VSEDFAPTPDGDLLLRMLRAWQVTRDPVIEGAIVRLGRQIARVRGPLDDAASAEHTKEELWFACAEKRRAGDVDRLLDTPWRLDPQQLKPRIDALAKFPPDPRIARRFAVLLRSIPSRKRMDLMADVMRVIERAATPSVRADVVAAFAGRGDQLRATVFADLLAAVDAVRPTAVDPALVAEAIGRCGDGSELAALWADHAADPHDLQRRFVLADALAVAGDPRGDFMLMQLATEEGAVDRRIVARAKRAVAVYADEWIGPLPLVDRETARFAGGVCVGLATRAGGRDLESALDRPEWKTLEDLSAIAAARGPIGKLVRAIPRLARLELGANEIVELGESAPYPGVRVLVHEGAWLPPRGVFPDLQVVGCAGEVDVAHRTAIDLRVAAIVHLGRQFDDYARARHAGPPELRFVTERTGWQPRGWYGRIWRGREDCDLVWAGRSREHGSIAGMLLALANRGVRQVRYAVAAGVVLEPREERELSRALDEHRSRIAMSRGGPRFDPFGVDVG
jgi:hypothetical protein